MQESDTLSTTSPSLPSEPVGIPEEWLAERPVDAEKSKHDDHAPVGPRKGLFKTGFFLVLLLGAILVATLDDMGLTDDDDFYVPASVSYAKWIKKAAYELSVAKTDAFKKSVVDRHWAINHEHPAVAKIGMGLAWLAFYDGLDWFGQIDGARMGIIIFAMLLLYLVFRFTGEIFGLRAAVFATLALFTMPRTFFHMHVATLDLATTCTVFLVVYAAWRAESRRIWILWAGIFYGVALCTKLNGPFVVFPLVGYWLYRWRQSVVLKQGSTLSFPRMFTTGISMALLSFPVFVLLWPWIWFDTIQRLTDYFNFHFHHYGIRLLYFGDIYNNNFAPWHAPFVYTGFTIPLPVLALGIVGLVLGLKMLRPKNLKTFPEGPGSKNDYALLCALNALFAISIVAFPNNPKYGGVKLFQPFFPFFAILAGYGFDRMIVSIEAFRYPKTWMTPKKVLLVGMLVLLPGIVGMVRVYPYMLSYYNSLAGNPQGATELGMERQYYDMCYRTTIRHLSEKAPQGAKIAYEPNIVEYRRTYPWYRRDGKLRKDISIRDPKHADFLILTDERRWDHYPELQNIYRSKPVWHVEKVWGVPLYTIYDLREATKHAPSP